MAAAIAATWGTDAKTLLSTDELWNQYIGHATLIYDSLAEAEVSALTVVNYLCDCGISYDTEQKLIDCKRCRPLDAD